MRKFSFGRRNGRGFGLDSHDVAVSSAIVAVTLIAAILIVALVDHQDPGGGPVAVPSATDIPTPIRTSAPSTRMATTTPSASASPTSTDPASQPPTEPARTESASPTSSPSTAPNLPLRPEVTILNNSPTDDLAAKSAPLVQAANFVVRRTGNYRAAVAFGHTVILYGEGGEGFARELEVALRSHDEKNIEVRFNRGDNIPPDGTLILVLTRYFKA